MKKIILIMILLVILSCTKKNTEPIKTYPINPEDVTSCELVLLSDPYNKKYPSFLLKDTKELIPKLFYIDLDFDASFPSKIGYKIVFHTTKGIYEVEIQEEGSCIFKSKKKGENLRYFDLSPDFHDYIFNSIVQYVDEENPASMMNYEIGILAMTLGQINAKNEAKGNQLLKEFAKNCDPKILEQQRFQWLGEYCENN